MDSDRTTKLAAAAAELPKRGVWTVPAHVRATHGPDGATVLHIRHGQMFRLNFVGSRILEFLQQGLAAPQIREQLVREFGIELATAEADLREFFQTLEKHELLTADDGSSLT